MVLESYDSEPFFVPVSKRTMVLDESWVLDGVRVLPYGTNCWLSWTDERVDPWGIVALDLYSVISYSGISDMGWYVLLAVWRWDVLPERLEREDDEGAGMVFESLGFGVIEVGR